MGGGALRLALPVLVAGLLVAGCGQDAAKPAPEPPAERRSLPKRDGISVVAKAAEGGGGVGRVHQPFTISKLPPGARHPLEARQLALKALETVVGREAGKAHNAWGLAHGILAKGQNFRATDGRRAVDVLFDDFLELRGEGAERRISFPATRGALRVEPHPDLILKTLVEAGFGREEILGTGPNQATWGQLLESSRKSFVPVVEEGAESAFSEPNHAPWSVQAWCQATQGGAAAAWTTDSGAEVNTEALADDLLGTLEREVHFLRQAQSSGEPVEKRRQHIFRYTCGGAHLLQGVQGCVAAGFPKDGAKRFSVMLDVARYRIGLETAILNRAMIQAPGMAPVLFNQDVKFLGHMLEVLMAAERDGLWEADAVAENQIAQLVARLAGHVVELSIAGAYDAEKMARLESNPKTFQFYLDLVGDACHALHGLRLWKARPARSGAAGQ